MNGIWLAMPMPDANIITVPYSPKSCRTPYGPSMNARSLLFVCWLSSAVKPARDFTNRDIVKPFRSWSHHEIMNGWPRSPVKIPSLGIERNTNWPASTLQDLGTVTSTRNTFDGSTKLDESLLDSRLATAVANGLPKTMFLNANKIQWTLVAVA